MMNEQRRTIRSYVLRSGRLSTGAAHALREYYSIYGIEPEQGPVDFNQVFPKPQPLIVEIGFGMGHATVDIAKRFPDFNFIGIEVYPPGVGRVLNEIHELQLKNLRIIRADAAAVMERMMPDASVHGFHVFFPDPWPKKKHHKRRLIQSGFLTILSRKLTKGGYFYAVTDWEDYAGQILRRVEEEQMLVNPYDGFAPPREWRPKTSFQRKGEEKQHGIYEIWAERGDTFES